MKVRKSLRVALVAEWALIVLTLIASLQLEGSLPAPLRDFLKSESERDLEVLDFVFLTGALIFVVAALTASVGLFLLRRWGRWLYLAATVAGYGAMPISGASVEHPVAGVLGDLAVLVSGLILGLVYFTDVLEPPRQAPPTAS